MPNEAKIHEVMGLIAARKYKEAAELIEDLLKSEPNNVGLLLDLAYAYTNAEKFDKAVEIYKKVIKDYPNNETGYVGYGYALLFSGKTQEAIKQFEASLKIKPDNALVYFELGEIYLDLDEFEKAIEYFNKAIQFGGPENDAKTLDRIARCKLGMEKPQEAIAHAKKMLENDPSYKLNYHNIVGVGFCQLEQWEDAIKEIEAYLEIVPEDEYMQDLLEDAKEELKQRNPPAKASAPAKGSKKSKGQK